MKQEYDFINPSSTTEKEHPPIIFLHGLGDTRRTWKKVASIIARKTNRKAYVPDARNHGESPWSDEKMDYDILTQDVLDFMDEHSIKKATIIGHSMGGRTAINFALKHPQRVDCLVVEDMTPRNIYSSNLSLARIVIQTEKEFLKDLPADMDLESARRLVVNGCIALATEKYIDKEKLNKHYDIDMVPVKKVGDTFVPEANFDAALSMMESNALVQNLPEKNVTFEGDTLFIYGSRSFFNLGKDFSVKKLFPRAVVKQVEGASHFLHIDSPNAFVDIVSEFLLSSNIPSSKY